MNKKALSLAICVALALPTASNALSLGDIESNSSLNQPFKGRINLLSTSVAEAKTLRIRVAPASVFNRVGIDRPAFLNNIRFRTTVQNGRPVILVSSSQPINEPFLNFLLEVSWPNGQLLKEYTVLLDPPVLIRPDTAIASNTAGVRPEPRRAQGRINRPAVQQRRATQQPRRVVRVAPAPRRAPVRRAAPARRVAQVTNYRVRRGDNLSKVARKLRYSGVRDEQMMIALFKKNSRAFSKRNINNLKAGVVLSRPSLQEVRAISVRKAKSMVLAQSREWKKARVQQIASKAAPKTSNGSQASATSSQARLEVVGSKKSITANSTQGSAGNNSSVVAELNKQLTMVNESLTTRLKENEELKSRVSELESLLRKKNRLITLKSEQLAQLQATMSGEAPVDMGNQDGIGIASEITNDDGNIIRPAQVEPTPAINNQPITDPIVEMETAIEAPAPVEPVGATDKVESPFVDKSSKDSFDIMGLLSSPEAMGIGGGSLLALLGGLWYMRRRKSTMGDDFEEFASIDINTGLEEEPLFEDAITETEVTTETIIDESNFVEHDEIQSAIKENDDDILKSDEQDDILQEADVYIVYGLHDQAESELKRAIDNNPHSFSLRAKLLENYKAAGDKEGFEQEVQAYMQMEGENKEKYLAQIQEWADSLAPDNNWFNGGATGAAVAAGAASVAMVAGKALASNEEELSNVESEVKNSNLDFSNQASDETLIDDLVTEADLVDDGLEGFNIDEVLSEEDDEVLDLGDSVEELDVDLNDEFEVDLDDDSLEAFGVANQTGALKTSEQETKVSEIDDLDMDFATTDGESESQTLEESISFDPELEMDSINLDTASSNSDTEIDLNFDPSAGSDLDLNLDLSTDSTSDHESDFEMANLNLDLDSDQMSNILPEDNAYTTSSNADSSIQEESLAKEKPSASENPSASQEDNLLAEFDDNLSFLDLNGDDEVIEETQVETRLDLAKAYIDMGDIDGARSTLEEVILDGNDEQKREAEELLHQTG